MVPVGHCGRIGAPHMKSIYSIIAVARVLLWWGTVDLCTHCRDRRLWACGRVVRQQAGLGPTDVGWFHSHVRPISMWNMLCLFQFFCCCCRSITHFVVRMFGVFGIIIDHCHSEWSRNAVHDSANSFDVDNNCIAIILCFLRMNSRFVEPAFKVNADLMDLLLPEEHNY